ncbi:2'-5' RNA ligase family protein [Candidatus Woesearchaeota archaeon]|nr:2'-5' RNA ligase family protein [Candidatus Woesearchaeota archaeon]
MTISITLNFFIPKKIVQALKKIKVSGIVAYDWRDSDLCHVTIKAISKSDTHPDKKQLDEWVLKSNEIISEQKPFKVKVQNVAKFPNALYTNIKSKELLKLHKKLFKVLPSSQPHFENNEYNPHASIGVLTKDLEIISETEKDFGEFKVKEIQLVIWDWNGKKLKNCQIYHKFQL